VHTLINKSKIFQKKKVHEIGVDEMTVYLGGIRWSGGDYNKIYHIYA
jgi:predicted small secreted protein